MERLLESIYINARPAMELRLSLTSSGRKRVVKGVWGAMEPKTNVRLD